MIIILNPFNEIKYFGYRNHLSSSLSQKIPAAMRLLFVQQILMLKFAYCQKTYLFYLPASGRSFVLINFLNCLLDTFY